MSTPAEDDIDALPEGELLTRSSGISGRERGASFGFQLIRQRRRAGTPLVALEPV